MPINTATIGQVRIIHHEDEVNQLLQEGWFLLTEPYIGLRKVDREIDGKVVFIDIPWREFVLGRRRADLPKMGTIQGYSRQWDINTLKLNMAILPRGRQG